jgi:hypothetical protein
LKREQPVTIKIVDQAAFNIGRLAHRMGEGYFTHLAAIQVATDPRAVALIPAARPGSNITDAPVTRKDGTKHVYDFGHYLTQARGNSEIARELERIWFVGALLTVGDALEKENYFDRAPELELLRHLRNGVAHGNAFDIRNPKVLANFPAHNKLAWVRGENKTEFEITAGLNGQPVLFDFMAPGDILDLLFSVEVYLLRKGTGESTRP